MSGTRSINRGFHRYCPSVQTAGIIALVTALTWVENAHSALAEDKAAPSAAAELFPLSSVRILNGPFTPAVKANREYMLALDPDRLLAPFRREAGLEPKKPIYGNWESGGLDGHTAGHYLAALADMIASGNDSDGELRRRLDYMVDELALCQEQSPDGYVGGIPGSRELWKAVAGGDVDAVNKKWVPWYNLHKTFAGLRDAYLVAGNTQARDVLIRLGDWAKSVTANLSDEEMQRMLNQEQGGMNEVLADIYAITKDEKYLVLARRFCHHAVLDPLENQQDQLTGLHANTQIPKVIGLERIAALSGDNAAANGAKFFWDTVTEHRSVAFGGNSVSEHFNDPKNFRTLLEHREGPETCNSYNMLRLTEQLFEAQPSAAYADYYERTLFNHILAAIDPEHPGYVYFTPIRPGHYRVYSQPGEGFWCCVGTGMENPGRYGQFVYAKDGDGLYVNLFMASELTNASHSLTLTQQTAFPDEEKTQLTLKLQKPSTFSLRIRHPAWVPAGEFKLTVNGEPVSDDSQPSSYAAIKREWKDGDRIDVALPMHTTVEGLPDGSDWYALLHGPIVLASPDGASNQTGLFAGDGRGDHIAGGQLWPLDKMPALLGNAADLPSHVTADTAAGPMHFRIKDVVDPATADGVELIPFFRLQEQRYQMYFELTNPDGLAARKARLAAEEKAKLDRDAATVDSVAVGEQQSETDHTFKGEGIDTGIYNGIRWRHGNWFQYTLNTKGEKNIVLSVTYNGGDGGRNFDIFANGSRVGTEALKGDKPNQFVEKTYALSPDLLTAATDGKLIIKFAATQWLAGGIFDLRLLKADAPGVLKPQSTPQAEPTAKAETRNDPNIFDSIPIGDDKSEAAHNFSGEGTETGAFNDHHWRHGTSLQYTLDSKGQKDVDLVVTYWGGDDGRTFDVIANDTVLATQTLHQEKPDHFFDKRYPIPAEVLAASKDGRVIVKFVAKQWLAGGLFDLRLEKHAADIGDNK